MRRVASTGIKDLSGGECRRVSIGVEAVHDPPVLILDEPTSVLLLDAGSIIHHGTVDQLRSLLADAGLDLLPHVDPVEFSIDSMDALHVHRRLVGPQEQQPSQPPPSSQEGRRCNSKQVADEDTATVAM
ncbi:hypothetical protein U9M48_017902 [Paspalum notatum var. saurae]|uniref:ABC transporter domain-containing protein n=1 Tax=Paspalum notatum var. saurae TaxID=547442 RepID=A0AAQ3TBC7_PASNO